VSSIRDVRLPHPEFSSPQNVLRRSITFQAWRRYRLGPPVFDEVSGRILARAARGLGWVLTLTVCRFGPRADWKRLPELDRPRPKEKSLGHAKATRPASFFVPSHRLAAVGDVMADLAAIQLSRDFPALRRLPHRRVVYPQQAIPRRAGEWRCIDCGSVFFRLSSAGAHARTHRLAWWSGKRLETPGN
jgi:hypothetical protein